MRVILVEPGKRARPAEIGEGLQAMQELVGGPIQALYPWPDKAAIVCNDEGKLLGLPYNRILKDCDILAGTFFVCGIQGEDFCSLTEQQMERYQTMFEYPEKFIRTPEGILCLRCVAGPETAKMHKPPKSKDEPER